MSRGYYNEGHEKVTSILLILAKAKIPVETRME
jgi:hypothetical protein